MKQRSEPYPQHTAAESSTWLCIVERLIAARPAPPMGGMVRADAGANTIESPNNAQIRWEYPDPTDEVEYLCRFADEVIEQMNARLEEYNGGTREQ